MEILRFLDFRNNDSPVDRERVSVGRRLLSSREHKWSGASWGYLVSSLGKIKTMGSQSLLIVRMYEIHTCTHTQRLCALVTSNTLRKL